MSEHRKPELCRVLGLDANEAYLTLAIVPGAEKPPTPEEGYAELARHLAQDGARVIQEKAYGRAAAEPRVTAARREAYRARGLESDVPFTFIDGAPLDGGDFGGVQIWCVTPRAGHRVETVMPVGRRWSGTGFDYLCLSAVTGVDDAGRLPREAVEQAAAMFRRADAQLAGAGFSYRQVRRTWIYLARLLDWYGDFNRVRTAFYREIGFDGRTTERAFPASTGIQGLVAGAACAMDVLALNCGPESGLAVRPVQRTARQEQAFDYGSAFSRAMVVETAGRRTVYCSGTASIDAAGRTVHVGDAAAQCAEMLDCLEAILTTEGGGWEHVGTATLFCANAAVYDGFQEVAARRRLPSLPLVVVRADVCRRDLLVEMELTAVI